MALKVVTKREKPDTLSGDRERLEKSIENKKLVSAILIGALFLIMAILLMVTDPVLLIAKYSVRVDYGTYIYDALSEESAGVHIATYLFNVTNSERFRDGLDDKLKVEEVGPFTYQETRVNEQLELDFNASVIRYSPRIWTQFLPDLSVAYPENLTITMPNLAMLSMASKVGTYGYLPRMGFNLLTRQLKSRPIVSMRASDYLWGYDEPLIRLGHSLVPGLVNFDILGVLDRLYDKKAKYLFEVSANEEDKFAIRAVNGVRGLDKWGYTNPEKRTICNSFANTYEGIAYPTEMTGNRTIRIYRTVLCRFLELDYHGTVMTRYGVEGLQYKISNRTYQKNEETDCLCSEGNCIEGVSDLSPCFIGLPVVLSNAHFMHANPKLYEKIEGIKPDEKRHGSSFVIEPKIGMVLDTQFTVQVSLLVRDVRFNSETSRFSDMLIPVVYFKITQPPLQPRHQHNLNMLYFIGPKLLLAIQILLVASTVGLFAYAAKVLCWNKLMAAEFVLLKHDVAEPLMK